MKTLIVISSLALAAAANAVSFSSFTAVDLHGVSTTVSGLSYTTTLASGAHLTYGGQDYQIVNGFGFYSLGKGVDITPSFDGTTQLTNWKYDEGKDASGSDAGWMDASKKGLIMLPGGGAVTLTYSSADVSKFTGLGYHFTLDKPLAGMGTGLTYYVTGNPVPEPASYAVLGLGLTGVLRRRKSV